MYQKRFELHRKPFQSVQRDGDHFLSESYNDLRGNVRDVLKSDSGVVVLTGPSGVGKTVTLETLRKELEHDSKTLLIRGGTVRSQDDFLYVLHRFLLKSEAEEATSGGINAVRRCDVLERLERLAEFWGPLTILLDDVHLVQADVFSELRMLLEENAAGQRLGRLMIAGPLSLEEILAQTDMIDFARRIRAHVFLEPLRTAESVAYLKHHFENAGGKFNAVFSPKGVEQIVVAAGGIPRCLNLLADETLIICEETDESTVTAEIVNTALGRLQHLAVAWNAVASDPEEEETSPTDSVVEIGGPVEVSEGVIEIGGPPSTPGHSAPPAAETASHESAVEFEETVEVGEAMEIETTPPEAEVEWLEEPEVELACCEFVEDDEALRDTSVIRQINELAVSLQEIEASEPPPQPNAQQTIESATETSTATEDENADIELSDSNAGAPSEDSKDVAAQVDDDECAADVDSLEHHLLLAASASATMTREFLPGVLPVASEDDSSPVEASGSDDDDVELHQNEDSEEEGFEDEELEQTATESISKENERIFEVILERATQQPDEDNTILTSFSAWAPAGSWPVTVDVSEQAELPTEEPTIAAAEPADPEVEEAADVDNAVEVGNDVEHELSAATDEFTEAITAPEPASADNGIYAVQLGNASPVFDRYTWSELGRSVSAAAPPRRNVTLPVAPPTWPVDVAGIAPDDSISVESVDDIAELDVEETSVTRFDQQVADEGSPEVDEAENNAEADRPDVVASQSQAESDSTVWTTMPLSDGIFADKSPEAESAAFDVVTLPVPADSIEFAADEQSVNSASDHDDAAVAEQESADEAESDEDSNPELSDDREAIIAAVSRTLQNESGGAAGAGSEDVAAVIASVVQRFIGEGNAPNDRGPASGAQQQLVAESEEESQVKREDDVELEDAEVYAPRLLQDARTRLIAVSGASGQLKQAAGAESAVIPDFEDQPNTVRLSIAEPEEESAVTHEESVTESADSGFGNLFTRLRRLRNGR